MSEQPAIWWASEEFNEAWAKAPKRKDGELDYRFKGAAELADRHGREWMAAQPKIRARDAEDWRGAVDLLRKMVDAGL